MIEAVGSLALRFFFSLLEVCALFADTWAAFLGEIFRFRFRYRETLNQMQSAAVESLPVIAFSLTFVSLMLIVELSFHMKLVLRQDSLVPAFSTVLMIRELGPVITCLLLTSRVGASIAAEIGHMRVTEQLDALRTLAIDPVEFLVVPRWLASVLAAVALSVISVGVAMVGGSVLAALKLGVPTTQYYNLMMAFTRQVDLHYCLIKATVFGTIIPIIASYHGFHCRMGSEGVGSAATSSVVQSSVLIIVADFVLTYLLYAV